MDRSRLDDLSRVAASARDRRDVMRLLVAGALGLGGVGIASAVATPAVAAQAKKKKKKCRMPMMRCGKTCVDVMTDAGNCGMCMNACPMDMGCMEGACQ